MKRALLTASFFVIAATAAAEDVYVTKPGKTPLKADASLSAPGKGPVGYGQKLTVKKKQGDWILVGVPGETLEGWINAKSVTDKRPGLDVVAVEQSAAKVAAAEGASTAGAIRGLDGRTADYAKSKQIPPEALAQLGRLEAHAERQFKDPHGVDKKGVWVYPDRTVYGRFEAAAGFARDEGLRAPAAPAAPAPKPAASPAATSATPAPEKPTTP